MTSPTDLFALCLSASLVDQLDKKIFVLLRGEAADLPDRYLMGTLRTFDQFSNIVVEGCVERHIVDNTFCDEPIGLFIIKGDAVALVGEFDEEADRRNNQLTRVSLEEMRKAKAAVKQDAKRRRQLEAKVRHSSIADL